MDTRSFHQLEHALLQAEYEIERLRAELVESQAREKLLQEVLLSTEDAVCNFEGYEPLLGWIQDVLAPHADHSALDTLLTKARADERERCAEAVEKLHTWVSAVAVSSAIRALGDPS